MDRAAKLGLVKSEDESEDAFRRRVDQILRSRPMHTRLDFEVFVAGVAGRGAVARCYLYPRAKMKVIVTVPWWRLRTGRIQRRVAQQLELYRPMNLLILSVKVVRR